eukprot:TRINITY_DN12286_c0_g2_i1.p2 TRINITY_DN12286_c0_g2~~TRINITY_DN12286_c0_g2_i1.p2  ORF type:complete len:136 (-),score=28.81 TRINITY_DN12286_c0_g2_i1:31-438(-)
MIVPYQREPHIQSIINNVGANICNNTNINVNGNSNNPTSLQIVNPCAFSQLTQEQADEFVKIRKQLILQQLQQQQIQIQQQQQAEKQQQPVPQPVSYTHLTLPTICSVQISVVAGSLKKKKRKNTKIISYADIAL